MSNPTVEHPISKPKNAPVLFEPLERSRKYADRWPVDLIYRDGEIGYEDTFRELLRMLGFENFDEIYSFLRSAGAGVNILDLMGGAYFIKPGQHETIDSVTGMRLGDPEPNFIAEQLRKIDRILKLNSTDPDLNKIATVAEAKLEELKRIQSQKKRKVIFGSVYDLKTWERLSRSMRKRQILDFGLVICRPQGPFLEQYLVGEEPINERQKLKYAAVFDRTFREVLLRINKKCGILLFQLPSIFSREWIEHWIEKTSTKYGLEMHLWHDQKISQETNSNRYYFGARFKS